MRFAVVGLGGATGMFHVPALQRLGGSELVGGCDLSAERRADFATRDGCPGVRLPRRAPRARPP